MVRYTEWGYWNRFRWLRISDIFFLNILLFSFLWRSCSWCRSNKGGEGAWQEVSSESLMHHCPAWLYLDCLKGYFNSCHCHEIPRQCHTKEDTKNGRILMLLRCSEVLGSPGFRPEFIYFFLSILSASNIWGWYFVAPVDWGTCRCSVNGCMPITCQGHELMCLTHIDNEQYQQTFWTGLLSINLIYLLCFVPMALRLTNASIKYS